MSIEDGVVTGKFPKRSLRHVRNSVVWLRFSDGTEGEVDPLREELYGEVFEPLRDKKLFRSVAVHPEWRTIAWPNGADFAPEFLHAAVRARLTRRSSRPRPRSRSGGPRAGAGRGGWRHDADAQEAAEELFGAQRHLLGALAVGVVATARRGRQPGGDPKLVKELEKLVSPATRGDPESSLRWTSKSLHRLAEELTAAGHPVSADVVNDLLRQQGYRLQANRKTREGKQHPDRDAQFMHIAAKSQQFRRRQ